jgi:hypothetical protein
MPEIRDIKPTGPTWRKRRVDDDRPRPDDRANRKERGNAEEPPPEGDKSRDGQIDEYA